jgi:hypothetical protein
MLSRTRVCWSTGIAKVPLITARLPAVLYWNNPLGRSVGGAQNGIFCRVDHLLANARRSSAAQNGSARYGKYDSGLRTVPRRP